MRPPRVVLSCAAIAGLLAVPAAASGQESVPGPQLDPVCDGDAVVRGQLLDPLAVLRSPGATIARSVSGAFTVTLPAPAKEGVPIPVSALKLDALGKLLTGTTSRTPLPCPPDGTVNVRRVQPLASFVRHGVKVAVVTSEASEVMASVRLGGLRGRVLAAGKTTATGPGRVALRLVPTPAGVRRLRGERRANVVLLVGLVDAQGHTGKPAPVRLKLR